MSGCPLAGTSQDRASKNRVPSSVPSWPCCGAGSRAGFLTSTPQMRVREAPLPLSSHALPATPSPQLAPPPSVHGRKATFMLVRHGRTGAPEGAFWALTSPWWTPWPLCLDHRWCGVWGAGAGGTSAWRAQPGNVIGPRPPPRQCGGAPGALGACLSQTAWAHPHGPGKTSRTYQAHSQSPSRST